MAVLSCAAAPVLTIGGQILPLSQSPLRSEKMFFRTAIQFQRGNLMAVEQVYDALVAKLAQDGSPVQSFLESFCSSEEAFDHACMSVMTQLQRSAPGEHLL